MDNTISRKETVMEKSGATREKSWIAVADGLGATKMIVDKFGDEHIEVDHSIRLRAAELIARAVGDIKPDGSITNNIALLPTISPDDMAALVAMVKAQGMRDRSIEQTGEVIDVQSYRAS